jgi:hypothetical protein
LLMLAHCIAVPEHFATNFLLYLVRACAFQSSSVRTTQSTFFFYLYVVFVALDALSFSRKLLDAFFFLTMLSLFF